MSAPTGLANAAGKAPANIVLPPALPSQSSSSGAIGGGDPLRRSSVGSVSTSAGPRNTSSTPRNGQSSRRNHRNHRKPSNSPQFLEEIQPDVTSPAGRKGTSITHLINWDVAAPRPRPFSDYRPRARRAPAWGVGSGYHAADKARYINSNYRFIVNPNGYYRAQTTDSDVHLEWELVLQVLASALTQRPNCPICLSEPVAPRMAKCGHIFCLPCLVRYMAAFDDESAPHRKARYKKCVICTDSVYMNDIRPVRFFVGQEGDPPKDGHDIVLRLMMRKQGSTLALPKDGGAQLSDPSEIPWYFAADVMDYARITKGTENYMVEQYEREIAELQQMENEDNLLFGEEGEWTRKAVSLIRLQAEGLKGMGNPTESLLELEKRTAAEKQREERPPIQFLENDDSVPPMYHVHQESKLGRSPQSYTPAGDSKSPVGAGDQDLQSPSTHARLTQESFAVASRPPAAVDSHRDASYFFYQALPHYYLSPLDIRILKSSFGTFAAFPSTVLPRVENVISGQMVDDDLRKRARYLAHLPSGCEVGFLECDWTDIVPTETLEKFRLDIERRRKAKRDKELKEERDRARAERLEDEMRWANVRQKRRDLDREELKEEDFAALAIAASLEHEDRVPSGSSPPLSNTSWSTSRGFSHLASTSPSNSASQRTVWGTPAVAAFEDLHSDPVPEDINDGWRTNWEQEVSLEEDVLAQVEMEESMGDGHSRASSHGKGQKKKKFKKVTLMTNGGRRGA